MYNVSGNKFLKLAAYVMMLQANSLWIWYGLLSCKTFSVGVEV